MPFPRAEVIKQLYAAFEHEPRIDLHHHPINLGFIDGALIVDGEVATIAAKKLAIERAAEMNGVERIIDRLRVEPAERKGDGDVRDSVCSFLLNEPALSTCTLHAWVKGAMETLRDVPLDPSNCGEIEIAVHEGVVTLNGHVISLAHKRFAGLLAWWAPGSRDVINDLEIVPRQEGNDDEITDAVRLALEKDPLVDADQVRVHTRDSIVTLQGFVVNEEEKQMAELDAWYIFGVKDVVNRIAVQS